MVNLMTSPAAAFADFRERVVRDPALFDQLATVGESVAFAALAVRLSGERGFSFTTDEVNAALQASRRAWIERNLP